MYLINKSIAAKNIINEDVSIILVSKLPLLVRFKKSSRNLKGVSSKISLLFPSSSGIINPMLRPELMDPIVDNKITIKTLNLNSFKYLNVSI